MRNVNVCFDLGGDSLKVSYCEKVLDNFYFGKIVEDDYLSPSTISSNAFYSLKDKKWLFGVATDKVDDPRYLTIVNIKKMLSLLINNKSGKENKVKEENRVFQSNKDYYYNQHYFPYFFFPDGKEYNNKYDFSEKVKMNDVFTIEEYTPAKLCQEYFEFVRDLCDKTLNSLGYSELEYTISIVYPLRAGKTYVNELTNLIENAFSKQISKCICQTKALTILAKYQGKIDKGDNFLVFDIGDEDISVAKASISKKGDISIEGRDGHSNPLSVGGNNIDEDIVTYISNKYFNAGGIGGKQEAMLLSKQYLLAKAIKEAKYILSSDNLESLFPDGVPINIYKDSILNIQFKKNELEQISGVDGALNNTVAEKLLNYIFNEIDRIVNRDVTKVFISGGVIETTGLFEYINKNIIKKYGRKISLYTFENESNGKSMYEINDDNDSAYASCLGCNIITLDDLDIPVCLSLSYGTYLSNYNGMVPVRTLRIFRGAERGARLNKDTDKEFFIDSKINGTTDEEFYSLEISQEQINNQEIDASYLCGNLVIYEPGSPKRREIAKKIGLNIVTGGKNAIIGLYYNGRKIKQLVDNQVIVFREGISVSPEGKARPFVMNMEKSTKRVPVIYENQWDSSKTYIPARDIKIEFDGVKQFDASEED